MIETWRQFNPHIDVEPNDDFSGAEDEYHTMLSDAEEGKADILNLDVIHIPEFADRGLIEQISLVDSGDFFESTRRVCGTTKKGLYWAAPFNTDVGMLFARGAPAPAASSMRDLLESMTNSERLVAQLKPDSTFLREAFVVNVLEHALSEKPNLLDEDGIPSESEGLDSWKRALEPMLRALKDERILPTVTEEESRRLFRENKLRYMRNWPSQYRELRNDGDADSNSGRIQVAPLPGGILGGQSLAIVKGSPHRKQATRLIEFLTSKPAQKVLAAYGFAPTRWSVYQEKDLKSFIPHLGSIRKAVEKARPRPIHRNYRQFSEVIRKHVGDFLNSGQLPSTFVQEMNRALS
ncbi:MAG TPA: extracellular solute-binding protein [Micromonosporaceae bacterium]